MVIDSQNISTKLRQKRRTIQCDNVIQTTGFKVLVANPELESLYRLDKETVVIYIPQKVITFRPHLCSEAILSSMDQEGGEIGGTLHILLVKMAAITRPKGPQGFKRGQDLRRELQPGLGRVLPLRSKSQDDSRKETVPKWQCCSSILFSSQSQPVRLSLRHSH